MFKYEFTVEKTPYWFEYDKTKVKDCLKIIKLSSNEAYKTLFAGVQNINKAMKGDTSYDMSQDADVFIFEQEYKDAFWEHIVSSSTKSDNLTKDIWQKVTHTQVYEIYTNIILNVIYGIDIINSATKKKSLTEKKTKTAEDQ